NGSVTSAKRAVGGGGVVRPPRPIIPRSDPYEGYPIDKSIPDVRSWNSCEVYEYFKKFFEPDVCKALFEM
ncbi:Hypothetical predicted protein, partial [Olea europaea subsp. europaea]